MKKYILLRSLVALLSVQDLLASNPQPLQINGYNFMSVTTGIKNENYIIEQPIPFHVDSLKLNGYDTLKEIINDFYCSDEYQVPKLENMRLTVCEEDEITSPVNLLFDPNVVPICDQQNSVKYSQFNTIYLYRKNGGVVNLKWHFCVNNLNSLISTFDGRCLPFDGVYLPTVIQCSNIVTLNSVAQNKNIFKIDTIADYFQNFHKDVSNSLSQNMQVYFGKNVVLLPVRNRYSIANNYYRLSCAKKAELAKIFENLAHELENEIKQQFSISLINQEENQKYLKAIKNTVDSRIQKVINWLNQEKKTLNEQEEAQKINIDNVISELEGSKQYILGFCYRLLNDRLLEGEKERLLTRSGLNEEDNYEELKAPFQFFFESLKGEKDTLTSCYNSLALEFEPNEEKLPDDDYGLKFIQQVSNILQCIDTNDVNARKEINAYTEIAEEYIQEKAKGDKIAENITLIDEKISLLSSQKESIQRELNKRSLLELSEALIPIKKVLPQKEKKIEETIQQTEKDIAGLQELLDSIQLMNNNIDNIANNIMDVLNNTLLNNIVQAFKEMDLSYIGTKTYKTTTEALIATTNYLSTFNAIITYMKSLININQENTPNLYNLEETLKEFTSSVKSQILWYLSSAKIYDRLIDSMPKDQTMNGSRQSKTDQLYQKLESLNAKVCQDINTNDSTSQAIKTGVTIQINKIYGFIKLYNHFVSSIKSDFKKGSQTSSEEIINQIVNNAIMATVRTVVSSGQTSAQHMQQDAKIKDSVSNLFSSARTNFSFAENIARYFSPLVKAKEDLGQLGKILKINKYANDISTIRKLINDIKNELTSQLEKHLDQFNIKSEQQIEQESEQETAQLDDEGCGEEYEC